MQNINFLENLYKEYSSNPHNIDISWQNYFFHLNNDNEKNVISSHNIVYKLLNFYRKYGHLNANINPLYKTNILNHNFQYDINQKITIPNDISTTFEVTTIEKFENFLQKTYCHSIGFELNVNEKDWLYSKVESSAWKLHEMFDNDDKEIFLQTIHYTKLFENYLHKNFVGTKRFSIEGCETLILALQEVIKQSAKNNLNEIVIGMPHRGRLSVLSQVLHKPCHEIFAKFMHNTIKSDIMSFAGDVKYHLGYEKIIDINGKNIQITLANNPSHLESINTVVMGIAKAKQNSMQNVLPILIHGDASFMGQGCVMETLAISKINTYSVQGIIHIIVNNQIGFTADATQTRGTRYCSDIVKGFDIPVLHVNGNDVEAIVYTVQLAMEYRLNFKKDIVIDIVCYRKYGHNEIDEVMFTQPEMYSQIHSLNFKDSIELYYDKLSNIDLAHNFSLNEASYINFMNNEYDIAKTLCKKYSVIGNNFLKHVQFEQYLYSLYNNNDDIGTSILQNSDIATIQSSINTGVCIDILKELTNKLFDLPKNFNAHHKIVNQFLNRKNSVINDHIIDWATAETLAIATLLLDDYNVRFTGEDVERGTFSQRHAVLTDQKTFEKYIPLNTISSNNNFFITNSLLSEFGALGYEYGYAINNPKTLTIWEAQFGDFANGAQIIIDQYIASAESKWSIFNNLVILLPHGYEGQGPEHSSARLERFLQLCAQNNIQICNCTTPASYFHILRRQILQHIIKPLIVMTPKSLLRHKLAISCLSDIDENATFTPFIIDKHIDNPKTIILCTGKVYYDLLEFRENHNIKNVSICRIEQLYPFPIYAIKQYLLQHQNAQVIWCQEEPQNMGAFYFIKPIIEKFSQIKYVGRQPSASPAVGFYDIHQLEIQNLLNAAFFYN